VPIELDHVIVPVNDRARSVAFYTGIIGLAHEGESEPFSTVRVTPGLVLLIAQWGTAGGEHLAFAMTQPEFDATFARIEAAGIPYGDAFDTVGNMRGPASEEGSRGMGQALYVFDPDRHLIEIRYYEQSANDNGASPDEPSSALALGAVTDRAPAIGAVAGLVLAAGLLAIGLLGVRRLRRSQARPDRLEIDELSG
jgi:catechol 2,3-dioxygenase-like lactoylglutathione lyase family enzyme